MERIQLKKSRKIKGYSRQKLAEAIGYRSGNTLYYWEKGLTTPPAKTMTKLARELDMPVYELFPDVFLGVN